MMPERMRGSTPLPPADTAPAFLPFNGCGGNRSEFSLNASIFMRAGFARAMRLYEGAQMRHFATNSEFDLVAL